jgi:hypothetical protein
MSCLDKGPQGKPLLNFLIFSITAFWGRAKVSPIAALECYEGELVFLLCIVVA